jgi:hypothetical protein
MILGGQFWQDNTTNQGKITARTSAGIRDLTFTQGDGFVTDFGVEPSSEQINVLLNDTNGIYALGEFSEYNNVARTRIARLTSAGAIDATVTFGTGFDTAPTAASILPSAVAEVSTVQVISAHGGSYFDLGDANGPVRVWMDHNNSSSPPAVPSGGRLLEVDMHNSDTSAQLATKIQLAVDADAQFIATVATDTVTITAASTGHRLHVTEPNSGARFVVATAALGSSAGSLVIGGTFTTYNSVAAAKPIILIEANGVRDADYLPAGFTKIFALVPQTGNLVNVVGYNSGTGKIRVARLLSTGNEDPAFTPYEVTTADPGFASMAIQTDGKLIVSFAGANSGKNLVRLGTNGSVDATYNVGTGLNVAARAILILSDGTVILGGNFTAYNSIAVPRIVKTTALGAAVGAFNPGTGFDGHIHALMLPSTGTFFYVAGNFTSYNGNTDSYERFGRVDQTTGAALDTRQTVNVTGRHRGTISQADSDTQALALANATALIALPCT